MLTITRRNLMLYFRDRTAVFFSFLSVIILIALYVFFLGDMTSASLPSFTGKEHLLVLWFIAGILTVTSVTTTLGAFGILVDDKAKMIDRDFKSSPILQRHLIGGYMTSALLVGISMCLIVLAVAQFYLFASDSTVIPFFESFQLIGLIILTVAANASMIFWVVSFFRTMSAFATASMVIGTFIGFLAGIYVPIGGLPDYLHSAVKWFPASHAVSLFRQVLMENQLLVAFENAPLETKQTFIIQMGVIYEVAGKPVSKLASISYLLLTIIVFSALAMGSIKRKGC